MAHSQRQHAGDQPYREDLPIEDLRDELLIRFYGTVGALRDLEVIQHQRVRSEAGNLEPELEATRARARGTQRQLLQLVVAHPTLYTDTYRTTRHSRDPRVAAFANELKRLYSVY